MQTARQYYEDVKRTPINEYKKVESTKAVKKEEVIVFNHKKIMFKALFMTALLLVIAIGFTAYGTSIKYQINQTEAQIEAMEIEINDLNLQVTANTSPETIESKAINELGMEYPSASQYVYIKSFAEGVYTAAAN